MHAHNITILGNEDMLTSIQSSDPTPSTVTVVELLSNTNFNAAGFLLVAMVTGTCQSMDSNPIYTVKSYDNVHCAMSFNIG